MELICTEIGNGVRHLQLKGDLDIAGVGAVETRFYAHCGGPQPKVLVDLSATGFVASLGIRLLLQSIKTAVARGGRLILWNPRPAVAAALEISGLGQFVRHGSAAEGAAAVIEACEKTTGFSRSNLSTCPNQQSPAN